MWLNHKYKTALLYTLYVIVVVAYLSLLQVLLIQQVISFQLLLLLIIPLLVAAYFFNLGKLMPEKKAILKENMLSARENEVVACVAEGIGNKQIAEKLFISENTVKTHIKNILSKLKLKNRTQVAQWYYENTNHPKG